MKIKECLGVSFSIKNPRDRITNNSVRKMSLSFAFGEFLWYLRGSDRLNIMEYYSKIYPNFSDDKITVNGAYGTRIFGGKLSQWEWVKNILSKDPDSRQAVISIYQPRDLFASSLDIPCTCVLQYFIRNKQLNAVTYMRSNDIYLGMPYDIFSFTMLQEMLAIELNVELGSYTHMVGSLHIYERNFNIFDCLKKTKDADNQSMPSMTIESVNSEQISLILETERALRKNETVQNISLLNSYWKQFVEVLKNKSYTTHNIKD
jgi:thymidylate synthase